MKHWWPLAFLVAFLFFPAPALAQGPSEDIEAQAREMEKMLVCPICPQQTLDRSDNDLALQMKALIRKKLAEGESREQIIAYFVDRYGESVLAAPPKGGSGILLWFLPLIPLAGAAVALYLRLRRWAGAPAPTASGPSLEAYRERVERELREYKD